MGSFFFQVNRPFPQEIHFFLLRSKLLTPTTNFTYRFTFHSKIMVHHHNYYYCFLPIFHLAFDFIWKFKGFLMFVTCFLSFSFLGFKIWSNFNVQLQDFRFSIIQFYLLCFLLGLILECMRHIKFFLNYYCFREEIFLGFGSYFRINFNFG